MGPLSATGTAAVLTCRSSPVSPHEVGINHDAMIGQICWLTRLCSVAFAIANGVQVVQCYFGHDADMHLVTVKFVCQVCHLATSIYANKKGRSPVFEVQALFFCACATQNVLAVYAVTSPMQWVMHDIVVMAVEQPMASLMIMCMHTVLEIIGHSVSTRVMIGTCVAINAAALEKTRRDMPDDVGLSFFACVLQLFVGLMLKLTIGAILKERDVLNLVRDELKQMLDSQDSMWKSVFDATLLCEPSGCIVSASDPAVDMFQFESFEVLGEHTVISLAAPAEKDRLTRFVQEVLASTSSQAMTIQCTFVRSNASLIELQVNAVRVAQNVCDSSSHRAFRVLLGMRLVESASDQPERLQDDELQSGSSDLEDMWIAFDAATDNFLITGYSPNFGFLDDVMGLLRWFPPMARHGLEQWVVSEVQGCGKSGSETGSGSMQCPTQDPCSVPSGEVIEQFQLRIPAVSAMSIMAERAWLEVRPSEVDEDGDLSLPVVLRLRGGEAQQWRRGKQAGQQLNSVPEDGACGTLDEHADEEQEQWSDTGSEDITPSDSLSVAGLRFRMKQEGAPVA